jgi:hypothetical protein
MLCFKCIGDVLQEDEPEYGMLVLGSIHVVSKGIGGCPELRFKTEVSGLVLIV